MPYCVGDSQSVLRCIPILLVTCPGQCSFCGLHALVNGHSFVYMRTLMYILFIICDCYSLLC